MESLVRFVYVDGSVQEYGVFDLNLFSIRSWHSLYTKYFALNTDSGKNFYICKIEIVPLVSTPYGKELTQFKNYPLPKSAKGTE